MDYHVANAVACQMQQLAPLIFAEWFIEERRLTAVIRNLDRTA